MPELTFEKLRAAAAGEAVALRSRTNLQPAGGTGDKVFPPTYSVDRGIKYATEDRRIGDRVSTTVLLDSVASQANRAELALLEGWESQELSFPVPFVDFSIDEDIADLGRLTALEAPHRLADAIFRDSLLDGTLFRLHDVGRAITDSQPRNATALYHYSPTGLLFGMWDSTGPKGGLGSKFQRAYVSEIVGLDAELGRKVSSRIDPLQVEREAAARQIFVHSDPQQVWTMAPEEAVQAKKRPKVKGRGKPSEINHGNIPPLIDANAGGVTISKAIQTTVISLAALRRLRFADHNREAEIAARTAVAALGVASIAYQHEMDYDLRSRCLLIPEHSPRVELLGRDGSPAEVVDIDRTTAQTVLDEATEHASTTGIGWATNDIQLIPAPKLIDLIKRSREVSATKQPTK
ncbi:MAG: type I-U CRISPR-associated RAMP protein Csb1/Cas7u [bacterium]|nr:type I-U CRISPR-associated RAMP protein Csb1/Cas7u [bacterium]